ncbi:5259_t:CDS:2, partial [Dentiscutata heterogama]
WRKNEIKEDLSKVGLITELDDLQRKQEEITKLYIKLDAINKISGKLITIKE